MQPGIPLNEPLEIELEEPPGSLEELAAATSTADAIGVAARWPQYLAAWAALGEAALSAEDPVHAYAFFRVGYHRGLDRLRQAGWRGEGRVPWRHESNRGFLRSLRGLGAAAEAIGEEDEAERCREFFERLAPDAPRE